MCGNFPNIKVVEGNAFSLVLPLKRRTFESCQPIDEDIDATQLTNVVVKFGGVAYTPSLGVDGVTIILPATLARGTYDIVLTAKYQGTDIRAAYESAISIVPWNSQSDAQQFVPGSPIVCDAAYIIGGALTDAELEQLKQEYREKNAQLDQAIADAEEAKREWEEKAADLDDVAQESTSQDILTAVENIDIDTSDLAKQGTNPDATLSEVQRIVSDIGADQQAVRDCYDIAQEKGLTIPSPSDQTLQNLPATMETIVAAYQNRLYVNASSSVIANTLDQEVASCEGVIFIGNLANLLESKTYLREVYNIIAPAPTNLQTFCGSVNGSPNLRMVDCRRISGNTSPNLYNAFQNTHIVDLVGWETIESVIANGTTILDGYNTSITIYAWQAVLNRASLRALINGLADRTGMAAPTLACGVGFANLTADDIQVATDKNWNVTA